MLSCMGLCTASSFVKLLLFGVRPPLALKHAHKHVACSFQLHKLHLHSIVCVPILCFSLASLYIFRGWMPANADSGFSIEFLHSLPSLCCFFSPFFSPLFFPSCFLPVFPDDRHPSMKSISHLGAGWHWHAGCAIWRLMAKLYYTIATIRSQRPIASSVSRVYELCDWDVFQHLILFFLDFFPPRQSVRVPRFYWPWPMILCVSRSLRFHCKTTTWNHSYFPHFSPFSSFYISVCLFIKRADCALLRRSWSQQTSWANTVI